MKYIVMHETNTDIFTDEFENVNDALNAACLFWDRMTRYDKKHCNAFYVLESVNPDPDAADHFDGEYVKIFK